MCARNVSGTTKNLELPMSELSISDIKSFFSPQLLSRFEHVMFCGVYGDPIVAKDTLPAVKYFKESGVEQIWFHTNGAARSTDWWRELAQYFKGPEDRVVFNVDGLADTNGLYRIGTSWEKIMANMHAFISAGGTATWCFLVFKHNEHQIDEAKELATKMGVKRFRVRRTSRFRNQPGSFDLLPRQVYRQLEDEERKKVLSGTEEELHDFVEYEIYPPDHPEYRNIDSAVKLKEINEEYGSFDQYLDKAKINCINQHKFKRLYLDFEARLWPCCFIPADIYSFHQKNKFKKDFDEKVVKAWGSEFNDIRKNSLEEILEHPWFREKLVDSWSNKIADKDNPRLLKCARTCGHKYNPILSQTQNIELQGSK